MTPITHTIVSELAVIRDTKGGASATVSWTNDFGYTIYVTKGAIWLGVVANGVADVGVELYCGNDIYYINNDDHYANRTGLDMNLGKFDASPGVFEVPAGATITLELSSPNEIYAGATFHLFYITELP